MKLQTRYSNKYQPVVIGAIRNTVLVMTIIAVNGRLKTTSFMQRKKKAKSKRAILQISTMWVKKTVLHLKAARARITHW